MKKKSFVMLCMLGLVLMLPAMALATGGSVGAVHAWYTQNGQSAEWLYMPSGSSIYPDEGTTVQIRIVEGGGTSPWTFQLIGVSNGYIETGGPDNGIGTPKTTEQMKQKATFISWDFAETWGIEDNQTYPFLRLTYPVGDIELDSDVDFVDFAYMAAHWLEGLE